MGKRKSQKKLLQSIGIILGNIKKGKALLIAFMDKDRKSSCERKVQRLKPSEETNEWIVWK